jgi:ABC-2 type transport system permease protein
MSITAIIMKQEWRLLMADRTALIALTVCVLAVVGAIANGTNLFEQRTAAIDNVRLEAARSVQSQEMQARQREQEIEQGIIPDIRPVPYPALTHPFRASWGAKPYALLPPAPLAALTIGQDELEPTTIQVYSPGLTLIPQTPSPLAMLIGHWDLTFVVIYLLPLIIIAITFNLLAGERDSGTLALLLSQPVTLRRLAIVKMLLRTLVLAGTTGLATCAALLMNANWTAGDSIPSRLASWCLLAIAYEAFWFGFSLWINSMNRSAAMNALVLVASWIFLTILSPSMIYFLSKAVHPPPSRLTYINAEREVYDELNKVLPLSTEPDLAERRDRMLETFFRQHPEINAYADYNSEHGRFRIFNEARWEERQRLIKPLDDQFADTRRNQDVMIARLSYLSPALLIELALEDVAGSGPNRYHRFREQIDQHVQVWRTWFWPKLFRNSVFRSEDYLRIPQFTFVEEPFNAVGPRTAAPFLMLWALSLAIAYLGVRRLKVANAL